MGVGNIIENNIQNGCQSIWKKVPEVPQLTINLSNYNKSLVSFCSLVGAYALIKSSIFVAKKAIHLAKQRSVKVPTQRHLQQKYGDHSWALIVDCRGNQEYCIFLAKNGFNLIICGQQDDIKIAEDRVFRETGDLDVKTETVILNWSLQVKNLKFYRQLDQRLKDFEISIIVMPSIQQSSKNATHSEQIPAFEHVYLVARQFGPRLKWRSNTSAIIVPSFPHIDVIDDQQNGITKAVQSGVDAFGRTLAYEFKNQIQVVISRGAPESAFAHLGKNLISH